VDEGVDDPRLAVGSTPLRRSFFLTLIILSRARSGPRPCSLSQQEYDDFAALDIDPNEVDEDDEDDDEEDDEEDDDEDEEDDGEGDAEDDDGMGDEEGMQALL